MTFDTAPLAVGLVKEFWYILTPIKFRGLPETTSTTISSVTSHSAADGKSVWSKGLIIYGKKIGNKYSFKKVNTLGIDGQIRNFAILEKRKKKILVSAINNGKLEFNEIN